MGYVQENGTIEEIKDGYHTVCPVYAADATEPFAAFTGMPLILPAVAAGHVVAEVKAASIEKEERRETPGQATTCHTDAGLLKP